MNGPRPQLWNSRVRIAFWIVGSLTGAINAYTSRYFINGDAIAYIEMGEGLRTGEWSRLANLTYSPGYPMLLGMAQALLDTNPMNELQALRVVSVLCLILAMGACDLLMRFVGKEVSSASEERDCALSLAWTRALCYSMFLVVALEMIRVRLLNPDMLVFAIVLTGAAIVLWIRENPSGYHKFAVLGLVLGLGYLSKSFLFLYSAVFLFLAGICCTSIKQAVPRVVVALTAMLVISAPMIGSLSIRLGRFTYGELGRHAYATIVSGKGEPLYPETLNREPRVLRFADNLSVTRPSGFDICYWHEGLEPDINFAAHLRVLRGSVTDLFTQTPWLAYLAVWFAVQWAMGFVAVKPRRFPSLALLLGVASFLGIALYCLIRMEPRYIGPYLFLGFVGLTTLLRYPVGDAAVLRKTLLCSGLLIGLCLGYVAVFSIDQTVRGLYTVGNKPSYRDAYEEIVAVKEFLLSRGVQKGDFAAVIGAPPDYWGRMAGLRIISEIKDQDEFIRSGPAKRKSAVDALIRSRVKAVVAKGSRFNELAREGWERAPHTTDYFVLILVDHGKTPG